MKTQSQPVYCYDITKKSYLPYKENNESEHLDSPLPFKSIIGCIKYLNSCGYTKIDGTDKFQKKQFVERYIKGDTKLMSKLLLGFSFDEVKNKMYENEIKNREKMLGKSKPMYLYLIDKEEYLLFPSQNMAEDFIKKNYFKDNYTTETGMMFAISKRISNQNKKPVLMTENILVGSDEFNVSDYKMNELLKELEANRVWVVGTITHMDKKYKTKDNTWLEDWAVKIRKKYY